MIRSGYWRCTLLNWLLIFIIKFYCDHGSLANVKYQTELLPVEVAEVLRSTHLKVFDKPPSKRRLAMAWAQIALENGQGKQTFNFNLGNIGAGRTQPFYFMAGHKFRSFTSFEEGGQAYWNVLKNRCLIVLSIFDTGDASKAAIQLEKCGYYRVEREIYEAGMSSLYNTAIRKILPNLKQL